MDTEEDEYRVQVNYVPNSPEKGQNRVIDRCNHQRRRIII